VILLDQQLIKKKIVKKNCLCHYSLNSCLVLLSTTYAIIINGIDLGSESFIARIDVE
jgi:hypothetical protein